MNKTLVEQYVKDPIHMRLYQQERAIYDVTGLIESVMTELGVNRSQLAAKLGQSKSWVTQLLDGEKNKTIRTVADVLAVLGREYCSFQRPIRVGQQTKSSPRTRNGRTLQEEDAGGLRLYHSGEDYRSTTTSESSPRTVEVPMRRAVL